MENLETRARGAFRRRAYTVLAAAQMPFGSWTGVGGLVRRRAEPKSVDSDLSLVICGTAHRTFGVDTARCHFDQFPETNFITHLTALPCWGPHQSRTSPSCCPRDLPAATLTRGVGASRGGAGLSM